MKTDFVEIFQTIRASLQPYATLGFSNRTNSETIYDLWSDKNVEIEGEQKNEVFFASVIIKEGYVGFCFMPEFAETEMKGMFDEGMLQLLQSSSCFHIIELDEQLVAKIEDSVAVGYRLYKDRGWV
jgi:hypothetical protein